MRKLLAVGIVLAFGALIAVSIGSGSFRSDGKMSDALMDWLTVSAAVGEGAPSDSIGQLAGTHLGQPQPQTHTHPRLPGALMLQLPYLLIGWEWALFAANALSVVSIAVIAWVTVRLFDLRWWWLVVIGCGLMVTPPVTAAMWVGSLGPLVAALVALTWLQASSRDDYQSGVWLGLATVVKLFPGLLIVMLWAQGRRRVAAGAAGVFGGLNLAGLLFPDVGVGDAWAVVVSDVARTNPNNLTIGVPLWMVVVVVVGLVWVSRHLTVSQTMTVGSVAMLALSPVVWNHYLPALYLPAMVVSQSLVARSRGLSPDPVDVEERSSGRYDNIHI